MTRRLIDPRRIWPDPEITDVQHVVEFDPKQGLERAYVFEQPVQGAVNIALPHK
jgi:hypothetical protein